MQEIGKMYLSNHCGFQALNLSLLLDFITLVKLD
jgi:hypothetical protein